MHRGPSLTTFTLVLLLSATTAIGGSVTRSSSVSSEVVKQADDTYRYEYTVTNTGENDGDDWPLIVGFFVPLDDKDDVWDIGDPDDVYDSWTHEFLTAAEYKSEYGEANPFGAAYLLHWYDTDPPTFSEGSSSGGGGNDEPEPEPDAEPEQEMPQYEEPDEEGYKAIAPGDYDGDLTVFDGQADGFVFFSKLAPDGGSFLTSWTDNNASPEDTPLKGGLIGGDESLPYTAVVPLPAPASLGLVGLGIVVLTGLAKRRRLRRTL